MASELEDIMGDAPEPRRGLGSSEFPLDNVDHVDSLNIRVFKDGSMWCALVGENLQEGIAAFGPSPNSALRNLCEEFVRLREKLSEDGPAVDWDVVVRAIIYTPRNLVTTDEHGPYCSKFTKITDVKDLRRTERVYCGSLKGHADPCEFSRSI